MNIWFIPIRCWSKSIPEKNIKIFCWKPLIYWTAKALEESKNIDKFFIAVDCNKFKKIITDFWFKKLKIYDRKKENANDTASTESVILEFINSNNFSKNDYFFLIQATNPFLKSNDIEKSFEKMILNKKDSILSCVEIKRFFWWDDWVSINYDYKNRPRRQDFKWTLVENWAIYINSIWNILKHNNRISGNIWIYQMPDYTFTEIDEEHDWIITEKIFEKYNLKNEKKKIKLFLTDVDWVLTDAWMYISEKWDELKKFNTLDWKAFEIMRNSWIKTWIITQENTKIVEMRAKKLNVDYLYQGINDKLNILKEILKKENINIDEVAYIWDDLGDKEILENVWIKACPKNWVNEIKNITWIIKLKKEWGDGCIREFIQYLNL